MKRFVKPLQILVILLTAYFLIRLIVVNAQKIAEFADQLTYGSLALGLVATLAGTALINVLWVWVVKPSKPFDGPLNLAYAKASLIRYIPGNVFGLGARVVFANQLGISKLTGSLSLLVEALGLLATTACLSLLLLMPELTPVALVVGAVAFPLLAQSLHKLPILRWKLPWRKDGADLGEATKIVPHPARALIWFLLYFGYGIFLGFGCAAFAQAVGLELSLLPAIGAFSLAWLIGYLSFLTPSGLGVREATLVLVLTPIIGAAGATVITILSRLAVIASDLVIAGVLSFGVRNSRLRSSDHHA